MSTDPTPRETAACECCGGDPGTVCHACGEHACWAGRFMCEDAATASTRETASDEMVLPGALANAPVRFWACKLHDRGRVKWRGGVAYCLEDGCGRTSVPDPGPFVAPFRQLIHNIFQFGEHWSWRCGLGESLLDPGYVDGACRYDHTVDSWEQLVTDATEHLRRWHDTRPVRRPAAADMTDRVPRAELARIAQLLSFHGYDAEATRVHAAADELDGLRSLRSRAREANHSPGRFNRSVAKAAAYILGKAD